MAQSTSTLLPEIETFLAETGMGESYFGKRATGNSELVPRLRKGGRVWPETAAKARAFMRRHRVRMRGHGNQLFPRQGSTSGKDTSPAQLSGGEQ